MSAVATQSSGIPSPGGNNTNATTSATTTAVPGGINGYVRTMQMIIMVAILGAAILLGSIVYVCCFRWYRNRAHRKIEAAGDVQVNVTRGGGRR